MNTETEYLVRFTGLFRCPFYGNGRIAISTTGIRLAGRRLRFYGNALPIYWGISALTAILFVLAALFLMAPLVLDVFRPGERIADLPGQLMGATTLAAVVALPPWAALYLVRFLLSGNGEVFIDGTELRTIVDRGTDEGGKHSRLILRFQSGLWVSVLCDLPSRRDLVKGLVEQNPTCIVTRHARRTAE